jgi:hypothetical protein
MNSLFQAGEVVKLKNRYYLVFTVIGVPYGRLEDEGVSHFYVYNLLDIASYRLYRKDIKEEDLERVTEQEETMVRLLYGKKSKT